MQKSLIATVYDALRVQKANASKMHLCEMLLIKVRFKLKPRKKKLWIKPFIDDLVNADHSMQTEIERL